MPKNTIRKGSTVTLARGVKRGTEYSPGDVDLAGVEAVATEDVVVRSAAEQVDGGAERERVTVRPRLPNGGLGMPLDVPVANLATHSRRGAFVGALTGKARESWDRIFGRRGHRKAEES